MRACLTGLLAVLITIGPACGQAPERSPAERSPTLDRIAQILPGGEFALASGLRVRLADLRLAEAGEASGTLRSVLASLRDAAVEIEAIGTADRWNRQAAALALTGPGAAVDIGELLVSEGLAVVDVGERSSLARAGLLGAEGGARTARRGLWAEPGWPLAADASDALATRAGRFAVVEGRVVSVGERRDRTYLNFGRDWSRDFAVTIPRRTWTSLAARGVTAASLTGAQVRVRGLLEMRRAPALDIAAPEMLEIVAKAPDRSEGRPRRR